jgi:hypothetical protein
MHSSPDQAGLPGTWAVSLSSITYADGSPTDDGEVKVNVFVEDCDLTPAEARELVQAIVTATAEAQR